MDTMVGKVGEAVLDKSEDEEADGKATKSDNAEVKV
jgi:hypothetical protein